MLIRAFPYLKFDSKWIFLTFSMAILLHMILFIFFVQQNKRAETKVNRDLMVQQVINLIERINYTSPSNRSKVVKAVDIPNLTLSFDSEPLWHLHVKDTSSLWRISELIRRQVGTMHLSLKYGPKLWLNISGSMLYTNWWWLQIFLLTMELVIVTAVILSIRSINRFAIPLRNFKKAADRLGVDQELPPLREYGPKIVRETALAMNQLQTRIHDLLKERNNMLAALSHDLRTPITRLKLRSQFIEDVEIYQKNIADLDQMETMIAEVLAFAKNNNRLEKPVKLDLNSLLASICHEFSEMGYPVTYEASFQRIGILGRPISLKRAVCNIIDNAIKYGICARVNLLLRDNKVMIFIDDEGPGIPPHQFDQVFEPFYRGDHSRSRETGGTGLGLAVAKDVIRSHDGTIELKNLTPKGLRVAMTFLVAKGGTAF